MAAYKLLGDKRLVNEIEVVNGVAYIRGERSGPPARWAAAPPDFREEAGDSDLQ